jgi:hypothetical protein
MLHILNRLLRSSAPEGMRVSPTSHILPGGGRRLPTMTLTATAPNLLSGKLADAGAVRSTPMMRLILVKHGTQAEVLAVQPQAEGRILAVAGDPSGACARRNDARRRDPPCRRHCLAVTAGPCNIFCRVCGTI